MMISHQKINPALVKVIFELEPGAWHGSATETLWAERVDERRFRIRNVPFFVFGIAFEDVIFANAVEGIFKFEAVSIRGGHSTYRIIVKPDTSTESIQDKWKQLEQLGCTYEQGSGYLRAIDVPPASDIHEVYKVLDEGEREGIWGFEEGCCGHLIAR